MMETEDLLLMVLVTAVTAISIVGIAFFYHRDKDEPPQDWD